MNTIKLTEKDTKRFWSKVNKGESGDCWEWQAALRPDGYGTIGISKKTMLTHRVSWALANGPIPDGMQINHHCDNRGCVNPAHLYAGTQKQNMEDRDRRGRVARGEKHFTTNLTENNITVVLEFYEQKYSQQDIAAMFDTSQPTISRIIAGKTWNHLTKIK